MLNPMQMMAQMANGRNPMQMMMQQFNGNPLFQRAQQMAQGKTPNEVQQIAQNLCNQRGIDINQAFQQFQQMFGPVPR
jgi:hypothetical protein